MRRLFWLTFILLSLTTAVQRNLTAVGQVQAEESDSCLGENLLINPSFEGEYSSYNPPGGHPSCPWGPCMTAQVADGWTPWWRIHDDNDPGHIFRMPEFKPAESHFTNPVRVRSGDRAQQYFTFYSTHEAGLLQQVTAVPGERYCLSVWGHSWSAQDSDDAYSGPEDGQLHQKVGIDPTGGTDWLSPHIVWSDPDLGRMQYDVYGEFVTTAVAESERITVFVYSQPRWAVKHNDVYWDDARLTRTSTPPAAELLGPTAMLALGTPEMTVSYTAVVTITANVPLTWQATLDPAGNLLPTLSRSSGEAGDALEVSFDTTGLPLGRYHTRLFITTDPVLPGTPFELPITAVVTDRIEQQFLPLILR